MRLLFQSAKSAVLTADTREGLNRSVCEGICCDVPVVMARDVIGGTPYIVNEETGILVDPDGKSVADGIEHVIENSNNFHPRHFFLQTRGMYNANRDLQLAISKIARQQGKPIDTSVMRLYGGDLWKSFEVYSKVFNL